MKLAGPLPFLALSVLLAGCQSYPGANSINWNDLRTDIALRHRYEQYSCAARALRGYSKDDWTYAMAMHHHRHERARVVATSTPRGAENAEARQALDQVRELSAKIDVLEDALKTNAGVTNQNQALIVDQIKAFKAELAQLKNAPSGSAATKSQTPAANTVSGIRFGTN
jgi:hypothetical protein